MTLALAGNKVVATVDPRYQSYNIEMVEVTGGEFWKPYDAGTGKVVRPPIDLSSERLRNLAKALGPAYIRVSGTWANSTYFDVNDTTGGTAPTGYNGVLTPEQWLGVGDFARVVNGEIVTSFAVNTGSHDANGVWRDDQARALLEFSQANDVPLVAAEFINEPSLGIGMPQGYTAADYGRDHTIFQKLVDEVMPDLLVVGPGSAEDVTPMIIQAPIPTPDLLEAVSTPMDVFSYHFYPKVSERCGSKEGPEAGLTSEFLSRIDVDKEYYEGLRDRYAPGAPMWITETAQAACGGDRWASSYIDVIRYVDVLGRLADGDGDVVFHNTLAASDYGLIDEKNLEPRPNYWAAVLWARLMGNRSLATQAPDGVEDLAVYAHCTARSDRGDVTWAVVNSSPDQARTVAAPGGEGTVYLLTGETLDGTSISLNGTELKAADDGTLPAMKGEKVNGTVTVPPASVAFVVSSVTDSPCA